VCRLSELRPGGRMHLIRSTPAVEKTISSIGKLPVSESRGRPVQYIDATTHRPPGIMRARIPMASRRRVVRLWSVSSLLSVKGGLFFANESFGLASLSQKKAAPKRKLRGRKTCHKFRSERNEQRTYIMPGIPPMPPGIPPGMPPPPPPSSGVSAIMASVVRSRPETLAAFCNDVRTTLVGSMTPALMRSS